jgi:hypothetical protein
VTLLQAQLVWPVLKQRQVVRWTITGKLPIRGSCRSPLGKPATGGPGEHMLYRFGDLKALVEASGK